MEEEVVYKKKNKKIVKTEWPVETDLALLTHYHSVNEPVYGAAIDVVEKFANSVAESGVDNLYSAVQQNMFRNVHVPFPAPEKGKELFTFIDLFAGIGGFRMALQNLGGRCVFTSEWDKFSKQTYFANYGEYPFGDITKDETKQYIPEKFDIICGGFPCQPFSIAGVSKKISLGRSHGFEDVKQGNLFFHIADIIQTHRPKAFFLENVKNLVSHDKKNTFKVIKETLEGLNYSFDHKIIDGKYFVPQHRERTLMVGFDKEVFGKDIKFDFNSVELPGEKQRLKTILQSEVDPKYTLSDKLWNYLQEYAKKHKEKGNGFGFGLADPEGVTRTISARYYKDGAEILIAQDGRNPRRLIPHEAAALQGYPIYPINTDDPKKSLVIPVSDNQAYRQFGNSVVMPLIQSVGTSIVEIIRKE
ncbi:DNA (cytosine-5-)-methyltransferase [Pedobacter nutrimenti]|uniref:Cytosine-specific methyltransferase n=1 Tax=Pedobacter nutrimenti TaxID=1241337 RepID=A0A318UD44_9SPHI|nr:DNA (cytosine-5-)-methyltransferase [Pedobacter nutrimenti]PYF74352.1 DNA (cytosine-5)-methyltransferase 1 [Pedobacter nutrimenti]